MGDIVQTELKIPDLWFDFFTRFLPGVTFVGLFLVFHRNLRVTPNAWELALLALLSFVIGFFTCPVASRVARLVEKLAGLVRGTPRTEDFVLKVQQKLGRDKRDSLILSKMHAEVVFFVQMALLSSIYWVLEVVYEPSGARLEWKLLLTGVLSVGLAWEVADRRIVKARSFLGGVAFEERIDSREETQQGRDAEGADEPTTLDT